MDRSSSGGRTLSCWKESSGGWTTVWGLRRSEVRGFGRSGGCEEHRGWSGWRAGAGCGGYRGVGLGWAGSRSWSPKTCKGETSNRLKHRQDGTEGTACSPHFSGPDCRAPHSAVCEAFREHQETTAVRTHTDHTNFLSSRLLCPMAYLPSLPAVAFLLSMLTSCVGSSSEVVSAITSQDVVLPCEGPPNAAITLLEWRMGDKDSEGFVFFFRENRSYESYQIPSFKHRVQLSDPGMKNGNWSVTVKNVTPSDSGLYTCSVYVSKHRSKRASPFSNTVRLTVKDGDTKRPDTEQHDTKQHDTKQPDTERPDGRAHLAVVIPVLVCSGLVVLLFGVVLKRKTHTEQPAAEEAEQQMV